MGLRYCFGHRTGHDDGDAGVGAMKLSPMKQSRGFSLVELMIAVVLGLLVTEALVSMFVGVRSASRTTSGVASLSDSGRYALNTIEQSVRGAGQMACNSTAPMAVAGTSITRQISLLNAGASPLISNVGGPLAGVSPLPGGEPLAGYEAVGTGPGQTVMVSSAPMPDVSAADWTTTALLGGNLDAALVNPPIPMGMAAPVGSMVGGTDVRHWRGRDHHGLSRA